MMPRAEPVVRPEEQARSGETKARADRNGETEESRGGARLR